MMTEIDGGQKDALLRRASIKKLAKDSVLVTPFSWTLKTLI